MYGRAISLNQILLHGIDFQKVCLLHKITDVLYKPSAKDMTCFIIDLCLWFIYDLKHLLIGFHV